MASTSYMRVGELSRGGMGSVELLLARTPSGERWYACKRMLPQHRADPAYRAMFLDEGRLAALVQHANVVAVREVGEDENGPYIITDFVDGLTLGEVMRDVAARGEPVPVSIALRLATEIARGLQAAHEAVAPDGEPLGLVHRDVSPHNVLVGFDGRVRITDFGIAKAAGNTAHTNTGLIKGNFGYLSPEQLRFETPDRRADLFALGILLHELLAGAPLYARDGGTEAARRILNEPPPALDDRRPDLPPGLAALVTSLLAKRRDERPATAAVVAERLTAIRAALPVGDEALTLAAWMEARFATRREEERRLRKAQINRIAREPRRSGRPAVDRRRRAWMVGGGLLLLGGAGAWALRPGQPPPREPAPAPALLLASVPVQTAEATRTSWAGAWHTCALRNGRGLFCWGRNDEGQTGTGPPGDRPTPTPVGTSDPILQIAAGPFHTCACHGSGALSCWGRNEKGQLGGAPGRPVWLPTAVPGVADCRGVAVGDGHTCVLHAGGTVTCFGADDVGQTGPPTRSPLTVPRGEALPRRPGPADRAPARALVSPSVGGLGDLVALAAGDAFTCALRGRGDVLCWGDNQYGQLGDGTRTSRPLPRPVLGLDDAVELALGPHFACARRRTGRVVCWGANRHGELGAPPGAPRTNPGEVEGLDDAAQIAAGGAHACALQTGGELACWGANDAGQLGGDARGPQPPRTVPSVGGPYLSVTAGAAHTCAAHLNGLVCFGRNDHGQLGDSTTEDRPHPVSVEGFRRF